MKRVIIKAVALACFCASGTAFAEKDYAWPEKTFRVCADPNYRPFSDKQQQGFENKIARLFADEVGVPVHYTWFPQRMGFIRNTLRAKVEGVYKCEVVMGVPQAFELAITTRPYYYSTYALVYMQGSGLDHIKNTEDLVRHALSHADFKVGLNERSAATLLMAKYKLVSHIKPYIAHSADPNEFPARSEGNDLAAGEIDATILWGPIAADIQRRLGRNKVSVIPLPSEKDVLFHFPISMGVRFGQKERRDTLNGMIVKHQEEIYRILRSYGVPLVDPSGRIL